MNNRLTRDEKDNLKSSLKIALKYSDLERIKEITLISGPIHEDLDLGLIVAANNGNLNVVKYLVEQGVNVEKLENKPILYSSFKGYLDIVQYLIIEHNCDPELALTQAQKGKANNVIKWCKKYIEVKNLNNKLNLELKNNSPRLMRGKI